MSTVGLVNHEIMTIFLNYKISLSVVSGGTDGIGKAYTFELARRGLRKFLLIGRSEEKLESVKRELGDLTSYNFLITVNC